MLKTLKQGDSNLQQLMGPHELRNALGSFINHHKLFKPLNELLKKLLNKLLKVNSTCDSIKIYSSKRNVTWRHRFSCAYSVGERCSESDLPWRSMAFESGVFPRRDISLVLDPLSLVILCNSCVRLTTRGICKAWIINPTND